MGDFFETAKLGGKRILDSLLEISPNRFGNTDLNTKTII